MKILSTKIILLRFNVGLMKISAKGNLSLACQLRSGFKLIRRSFWLNSAIKWASLKNQLKFFEVIFGPSYGQLNNEGKYLKCLEFLNDNLRQVLTIMWLRDMWMWEILATLSPSVSHQHQSNFGLFSKTFLKRDKLYRRILQWSERIQRYDKIV